MSTQVVVWDPLVRGFHWLLAAAFLLDRFVVEGGDAAHEWLGYAAVALVVLRGAWGLVARGAARWSDFWPTPQRVVEHCRDLVRGRPHRRLGHSPLGALVMIAMMLGIVALGVTGYAMEEIDYFWGDERLHRIHDWTSDIVTALAALHILAAIVQSLWLRENLPLSMITGRRRAARATQESHHER